jgi:histidinol-phosphate aminotransferase
MSRFLSKKYAGLAPYVPGEQPQSGRYIKLNTNESPFDVPPAVVEAARGAAEKLRLYPDPDCRELTAALAESMGVGPDQIVPANGSDEVLDFAFLAFCDGGRPALFPDVTYGFYRVFAAVNGVPYREIPLRPDFSVAVEDYAGLAGTVFLANPNAPTGLALPAERIRALLDQDRDRVVVVDEAYVDFGGESAAALIPEYDNLLVTRTFSKSRSMAGARLGYAAGSAALIADLNAIRFSVNPYNLDRMTLAAGAAMLKCEETVRANCRAVAAQREKTAAELAAMGFELTDSRANFLFARYPGADGETLYRALKDRGILVRHFSAPRTKDFVRITVGSPEDMRALTGALAEILEGCACVPQK